QGFFWDVHQKLKFMNLIHYALQKDVVVTPELSLYKYGITWDNNN
ncbi:16307_t:CDS:2, partial [Racocetra persica]